MKPLSKMTKKELIEAGKLVKIEIEDPKNTKNTLIVEMIEDKIELLNSSLEVMGNAQKDLGVARSTSGKYLGKHPITGEKLYK